ncbi:MAG: hypothetical protein KDA24_30320, partial [Deltaproteobacteria bacterium]|nr:hypothetical protein [Deltaproteobacteria bacterium]
KVTTHSPTPGDAPTIEVLEYAEGGALLSVGSDGRVLTHQANGKAVETTSIRPPAAAPGTVALNRSGRVAALLSEGILYVTEFEDFKDPSRAKARSARRPAPGATLLAVDPDGGWIAYGDGTTFTLLESEALLHGRSGKRAEFTVVLDVPDAVQIVLNSRGERLTTISPTQGLTAWDLLYARDGSLPVRLDGFPVSSGGATLDPAGQRVVAISGAGINDWATPGGPVARLPLSSQPLVVARGTTRIAVAWTDRIAVYTGEHEGRTPVWNRAPEWTAATSSPPRAMKFNGGDSELLVLYEDGRAERRDTQARPDAEHAMRGRVMETMTGLGRSGAIGWAQGLEQFVLADVDGQLMALDPPHTKRDGRGFVSLSHLRAPGPASASWSRGRVAVASAPDGVFLSASGSSGRIVLSKPNTGPSPIRLDADPQSGAVLVARTNAALSLYRSPTAPAETMRGLNAGSPSLSLGDSGRAAVSYDATGLGTVFDTTPLARGGSSDPSVTRVRAVTPTSARGRWLVGNDGDAFVHLWNGDSGALLGAVRACAGGSVRSAAGSPDGSVIAVGCDDGRVEWRDALLTHAGKAESIPEAGSIEALVWASETTLLVGDSVGRVHTIEGRERDPFPWIVSRRSPITAIATG